MAAVLLVLKIIGKLLLFLLLLLFLILLYLLLLPFHYEASVFSGEILKIHGKLRTFLHMIGVDVRKDDGEEISVSVTVLWGLITLFPRKEKAASKEEKEEKAEESLPDSPDEDAFGSGDEAGDSGSAEEAGAPGSGEEAKSGAGAEEAIDPGSAEEAAAPPAAHLDRAEGAFDRLEDALDHLDETLDELDETLDGLDEKRRRTEKLIRRYTDPRIKAAIVIILKELIWLLKGYMPKKSTADLTFSVGTPDGTGEVFAVMAVLPMFRDKTVYIAPDFMSDDPYMKGEAALQGNIMLGRILAALIKIISHSECRYLVKQILGGRKDGKGK